MVLIQDNTKWVLQDFPQFWDKSIIDNTYADTPNLN